MCIAGAYKCLLINILQKNIRNHNPTKVSQNLSLKAFGKEFDLSDEKLLFHKP